MSLFDFLKKRIDPVKSSEAGAEQFNRVKKAKIEKKVSPKKKEIKEPSQKPSKKRVSGAEVLVLQSPHVTEKATDLSQENKYVFKVSKRANKNDIKRAIEGSYNVDIESVRIINVPKKKRKLGRQEGWRKGYKKAIVKAKKGQKIEILPR